MKLPPRLEAWDADEADDGWALDVKDVKEWLEKVIADAENGDFKTVISALYEFKLHIE